MESHARNAKHAQAGKTRLLKLSVNSPETVSALVILHFLLARKNAIARVAKEASTPAIIASVVL
jgi:hypothetical protein